MSGTESQAERRLFEAVGDSFDVVLGMAGEGLRMPALVERRLATADQMKVIADRLRDDEVEACEEVLAELLKVFAHSFFVALDGGSERSLVISDPDTGPLPGGLNERWVDFLFETGRAE